MDYLSKGSFIKFCKLIKNHILYAKRSWLYDDHDLCKWIYHQTPNGKRQFEDEMRQLDEKHNRSMKELARISRLYKELPLHDPIIVDTNVFMVASDAAVDEYERYEQAAQFLEQIERRKIKIHIVASQLNELANMKDDAEKAHKVREAKRRIETLQVMGLLNVLGDVKTKESYADREIINITVALRKKGRRPVVITEDRDLRIRLRAEDVLCNELSDFWDDEMLFNWDWM